MVAPLSENGFVPAQLDCRQESGEEVQKCGSNPMASCCILRLNEKASRRFP